METYISRNNNTYYLEQIKNMKGINNTNGNPFTEQRDLDSWVIQYSGVNKLIQMKFESFRQALEHIEHSENPSKDILRELIKFSENPELIEENRGYINKLRADFNKVHDEISVYLDGYLK